MCHLVANLIYKLPELLFSSEKVIPIEIRKEIDRTVFNVFYLFRCKISFSDSLLWSAVLRYSYSFDLLCFKIYMYILYHKYVTASMTVWRTSPLLLYLKVSIDYRYQGWVHRDKHQTFFLKRHAPKSPMYRGCLYALTSGGIS